MLSVTNKNYFKKIAGLEPTISSMRGQRLYHCSTETQLTEKTVKLILIHASVDSLNSLNSAPFGKNPNARCTNIVHVLTRGKLRVLDFPRIEELYVFPIRSPCLLNQEGDNTKTGNLL